MNYKIEEIREEEIKRRLPQLLELPDPPNKLFMVGQLPQVEVYLSVVGSRRYTDYGSRCCHELILGLQGRSVAIVSGLAYGIDEIAHRAALEAKLPTIAFPGSGLDPSVLYPRGHMQLAEEIIFHGGCIFSEFETMEKAAPWTFPQRNRLMAGIAKAVLIVEAEEKSGTLITARLATEYNRDVLAVPGSIHSSSSAGCNFLLRQGATPITCPNDLLQALGLNEEIQSTPFSANAENAQRNLLEQIKTRPDISPEELEIINLLAQNPMSRDQLISQINRKVYEISATLTVLEITGLIVEKFGQLWIKQVQN